MRTSYKWASHALALIALGLLLAPLQAANPPAAITEALASFRTEGPPGWSYTQTTRSGGEVLVERFDPIKPEFLRWTLVEKNGRAPDAEETETYKQGKFRRSSAWNAPRLEQQLDRASCEVIEADSSGIRCRFKLKPDSSGDAASEHLAVIIRLHLPTRCIESVEIVSQAPFSPVFGIRINESSTLLRYSLPNDGKPSLLLNATLRVRGRAFWIKAIKQDMEVTWSEHGAIERR